MLDTLQQINLSLLSASGLALQTVADKLFWAPVMPATIRHMMAIVTTALTGGDQAVVALEKRITAGSDTGRVTTGVPTITIPGGTAQGKVYYTGPLAFKVVPGEECVLKLTDASAAGAAHIVLWVEPTYENPLNNANMVLTA